MEMQRAEVFVVRGTDTVLRNKPVPAFLRGEDTVNLLSAINGHDACQVVLQAKENIESYEVETSDLVGNDGAIGKDNIRLYHCKYTLVKVNTDRFYGKGEGEYPNAILPFSAAMNYGENTVKKGNTQSVLLSVYVPDTTKSGTYTGEVYVTVDGERVTIPMRVEVANVAIPAENHLRTLFLSDWDWQGPSKEYDIRKYLAYNDVLSEYRLSPYTLIPYPREEDLDFLYEYHAQLAYEYCLNPINSTFAIPYRNWERKRTEPFDGARTLQNEKELGLECDVFEKFLSALIRKSLEKKFNIYKKAVAHFGRFIDEPNGQGTMYRLIETYRQYHGILNDLAQDIIDNRGLYMEKYGVTSEFIDELAADIREMPHIITAHYDAAYDAYIDYYCPCFWALQPEGSIELYDRPHVQKEKWWYGCNGPTSPCPSYHLDDHLLSPRMLSWLQYKYDFTGNLYWGVNCYDMTNDPPYYEHYSEIKGAGSVNGDGWLMFPGEIYGLNKPVASLRMDSIRAGMEDYEILCLLEENYARQGKEMGQNLSFRPFLSYYLDSITKSIKMYAEREVFDFLKKTVYRLTEWNDRFGLCIFDLALKEDALCGKIAIHSGCALTIDCAKSIEKTTENGFDVYTFAAQKDGFVLRIDNDGKEETLDLSYPTKSYMYTGEQMASGITNVDSKSQWVADGNGGLDFTVPTADGLVQTLKMEHAAFATLQEKTVALILRFYNSKDEKKYEGFGIKAKFEKEAEPRDMLSSETYLPPENGYMPIYLAENDWERSGKLEYLLVSFGQDCEEYRLLSLDTPIKKYLKLVSMEIVEKI